MEQNAALMEQRLCLLFKGKQLCSKKQAVRYFNPIECYKVKQQQPRTATTVAMNAAAKKLHWGKKHFAVKAARWCLKY